MRHRIPLLDKAAKHRQVNIHVFLRHYQRFAACQFTLCSSESTPRKRDHSSSLISLPSKASLLTRCYDYQSRTHQRCYEAVIEDPRTEDGTPAHPGASRRLPRVAPSRGLQPPFTPKGGDDASNEGRPGRTRGKATRVLPFFHPTL